MAVGSTRRQSLKLSERNEGDRNDLASRTTDALPNASRLEHPSTDAPSFALQKTEELNIFETFTTLLDSPPEFSEPVGKRDRPDMPESYSMPPEWARRHSKKVTTDSKKLAPAAFPSLPLDEPSRAKAVITPSCAPALVPRAPAADPCRSSGFLPLCDVCGLPAWPTIGLPVPPRAAHDRSPCLAHLEALCIRKVEDAKEIDGDELIWEPSPLRRIDAPNIVHKTWWKAVEIWYALPPVDLSTVERKVRREIRRLIEEGTLQAHGLVPGKFMGHNSHYSSLEKLTAQRKVLETKLRIMRFERAKLRGFTKPSQLQTPSETVNFLWKRQQQFRHLNNRLAHMVNQALDVARSRHAYFTLPPDRRKVPLKGTFRSHTVNLPPVRHGQNRGRSLTVLKVTTGKSRTHRVRELSSMRKWLGHPYVSLSDQRTWSVPGEEAGLEDDTDATDFDGLDAIGDGDV